jgi:hypothetical protein
MHDSIRFFLILLVEVLVYSVFVYFVFSKTKGDVSRRWKASVVCSVVFGLSMYLIFSFLVIISRLMQGNFPAFIIKLLTNFSYFTPELLVVASLFIMPVIILGTFIAYARFEQRGDRSIDQYWRNPKINYPKGKKPPFF